MDLFTSWRSVPGRDPHGVDRLRLLRPRRGVSASVSVSGVSGFVALIVGRRGSRRLWDQLRLSRISRGGACRPVAGPEVSGRHRSARGSAHGGTGAPRIGLKHLLTKSSATWWGASFIASSKGGPHLSVPCSDAAPMRLRCGSDQGWSRPNSIAHQHRLGKAVAASRETAITPGRAVGLTTPCRPCQAWGCVIQAITALANHNCPRRFTKREAAQKRLRASRIHAFGSRVGPPQALSGRSERSGVLGSGLSGDTSVNSAAAAPAAWGGTWSGSAAEFVSAASSASA